MLTKDTRRTQPWWERRMEYLAAAGRAADIDAERLRQRQARARADEQARERRRAIKIDIQGDI